MSGPLLDTLTPLAERLAAEPGAAPLVRDLAAAWGWDFGDVFAAADVLRRDRFARDVRERLAGEVAK